MHDERDDIELRRRFAALREEDAVGIPPFGMPVRRPRPRRLPVGLAAAAAALVVAGALWLSRVPERDALAALGIDLGETTWTSPTDFLLNTPGAEFFGDLPTLFPLDSLAGSATDAGSGQPNVPEDFS